MSAECHVCGYDLRYAPGMTPVCSYCEVVDERDHWKRLFNRLEAAISHHRKKEGLGAFCDDTDEALWVAQDRILKAATRGPEPKVEASKHA